MQEYNQKFRETVYASVTRSRIQKINIYSHKFTLNTNIRMDNLHVRLNVDLGK